MTSSVLTLLSIAAAAGWYLDTPLAAGDAPVTYKTDHTMKVGGDGRWDYVTCSADGTTLYVPRSTHTMVLAAATGTVIADIPDTQSVHGVALVPSAGRGFISEGKGSVTIFDLKTNKTLGRIAAKDDADCIIYDAPSAHVLAFCGDAAAMVPVAVDVDPATGKADAAVDLGGKPEYAVSDGAGHVYANIEDKDEVVAIDTKTMAVTARHPLAPGKEPTGMAMDPVSRRLFIGCHNQLMIVMNADTGAVVGQFPIGKGVDATAFYKGEAFASCGDGTLTIIHEDGANAFSPVQSLITAKGARTMAIDPSSGIVYLPTAEFGETPAPSAEHPHPRPPSIPGSFKLVVAVPLHAGK